MAPKTFNDDFIKSQDSPSPRKGGSYMKVKQVADKAEMWWAGLRRTPCLPNKSCAQGL